MDEGGVRRYARRGRARGSAETDGRSQRSGDAAGTLMAATLAALGRRLVAPLATLLPWLALLLVVG